MYLHIKHDLQLSRKVCGITPATGLKHNLVNSYTAITKPIIKNLCTILDQAFLFRV